MAAASNGVIQVMKKILTEYVFEVLRFTALSSVIYTVFKL